MRIQSIEKFLLERERTEEEKKLAKDAENFYNQLYFLSLQDVNEEFYYKVKKLENDYTYLENLFSDQLPTNIFFDTQAKVFWALGEIYGKDKMKEMMSTKDQEIIKGEYTKEELKEMVISSVYKKDASGNIYFPQQIEPEKYQKQIVVPKRVAQQKEDEFGQKLSSLSETLLKDENGGVYNETPKTDIDYEKLDEEVLVLKKALQDNIFTSINTAIKVIDVFYKVDKNIVIKYVKYISNGKEKEITYEEFINAFGIGETKRKINI